MQSLQLGMIGAGHLASALARAFVQSLPAGNIRLSCPFPAELEPFAAMGCRTGTDNTQTVAESDLTVLIVRPAVIETVLREIAPVSAGKCFLSVAAGVSIDFIRSFLPRAHVMRAMPNTPAAVGLGTCALAVPPDVPGETARTTLALLECAGTAAILPESQMDTVTALSGSAPAYFFRMASVMADWARERGMDYDTALRCAAQTMSGAAAMLTRAGKSPEQLAADVAVPGGTTRAAFDRMDELGWDDALRAAMTRCAERAAELGR